MKKLQSSISTTSIRVSGLMLALLLAISCKTNRPVVPSTDKDGKEVSTTTDPALDSLSRQLEAPLQAGGPAPLLVVPLSNASPADTSFFFLRPSLLPCAEYRAKSAELVLHLDYGDNFELGRSQQFGGSMDIDVVGLKGTFSNQVEVFRATDMRLEVNQDAPEMQLRFDYTGKFEEIRFISVRVRNLNKTGAVSAANQLRIRVDLETDFQLKAVSRNTPNQPILTTNGVDFSTFPPTFDWRSSCSGHRNYELQLMRLYNQGPVQDGKHIQATIDWSHALTVETGSPVTELKLHPGEGSGFYIWRVRPIGSWYPGGAANPQNQGLWAGQIQANASEFNIEEIEDLGPAVNIFYYEDPEADKNWIYQRNFNEGDHLRTAISDGINYANGLGQSRQTLNRQESGDKVLSRQELYDYSGRISLNTLGAPLPANSFAYQSDLLKNSVGQPYGPADFDQGDRVQDPAQMSGPVVEYFDQNPHPSVSGFEGYPYARTLYLNDPLSRTKELSGPSPKLKLGSGHTTRSYFSRADEIELLRVFGDEAPRSDRVYKSTTVNEDGVAAVTYFEGDRVIATCLQATGGALSETMPSAATSTYQALGELANENGGLFEKSSFTIVAPKTIRLSYQIEKKKYADACAKFCAACQWEGLILIRKTNVLGNQPIVYSHNFEVAPTSCGQANGKATPALPSVTLDPGSYSIERVLLPKESAGEAAIASQTAGFRAELDAQLQALSKDIDRLSLEKFYEKLKGNRIPTGPDGKEFLFKNSSCEPLVIPVIACEQIDCENNIAIQSHLPPRLQQGHLGMTPSQLMGLAKRLRQEQKIPCAQIWACWMSIVDNYDDMVEMTENLNGGHAPDSTELPLPNEVRNALPAPDINLARSLEQCLGVWEPQPFGPNCRARVNPPDNAALAECAKNGGFNQPGISLNVVTALKDSLESICESQCDGRRREFYDEVLQAWKDAGYTIISRKGYQNRKLELISFESMECMVDKLVADCKAGCAMEVRKEPRSNLVSGVFPVDQARFGAAFTGIAEISIPPPVTRCPGGFRFIPSGTIQSSSIHSADLLQLNAVLQNARPLSQPTTYAIGNLLSPYNLGKTCSIREVVLYPRYWFKDPKTKILLLWKQFFRIRDCRLEFVTRNPEEEIVQVVCDDICSEVTCPGLCMKWRTVEIDSGKAVQFWDCETQAKRDLKAALAANAGELIRQRETALRADYQAQCFRDIDDRLQWDYPDGKYHYTLFYYDRAGNLVKTVPPEGVKVLSSSGNASLDRQNMRQSHPAHDLETEYEYNSLGQRMVVRSPDAGSSTAVYDHKGRPIAGRNARQELAGKYSYMKYDYLDRMVESGEANESDRAYTSLKSQEDLPNTGLERVNTVYSQASPDLHYLDDPSKETQQNLLNRVAMTSSDDGGSAWYSYDAHGNVTWMAREMEGLPRKFVRYEYDLISGKVLKVCFNEGKEDQFFQQYIYDADNRFREVQTSRDGHLWERDARYLLLSDGRLHRVELGEDQLQGIDLIYNTAMGLKAMNDPRLDPEKDPGKDGKGNRFAKDVWGQQLNRYQGDYVNRNHSLPDDLEPGNDLFSQTITEQISRAKGAGLDAPHQGQTYRYDEIGRLVSADSYSPVGSGFIRTDNFSSKFTYDANGNFLSLQRDATAEQIPSTRGRMDRLTYHYSQVGGRRSNRLDRVTDAISTPDFKDDLESQASGNYGYDASGRLLRDRAAGISKIGWTHANQVEAYFKQDGSRMDFRYDPDGNREMKLAKGIGREVKYTYYFRGPSGEVLSVYESESNATPPRQVEIPIRGLERMGLYLPESGFAEDATGNMPAGVQALRYRRELSRRQYEVKDHLGNVRVVIGDWKEPVSGGSFEVATVSAGDYYPYGMAMPGRTAESDLYRYGFNGMEKDDELKGQGNAYNFGARAFDPRVGNFLSIDPDEKNKLGGTPYRFASNNPINAIDLNGEKTFFIHGTTAYPWRWYENKETIPRLMELTRDDPSDYDATFSWHDLADLTNGPGDREEAAERLAAHVLANLDNTTDPVTLIGHSHGGNVAIQAATMIFRHTRRKVNIITIATPAANYHADDENPGKYFYAINDHIHLYTTPDAVQYSGLLTLGWQNGSVLIPYFDYKYGIGGYTPTRYTDSNKQTRNFKMRPFTLMGQGPLFMFKNHSIDVLDPSRISELGIRLGMQPPAIDQPVYAERPLHDIPVKVKIPEKPLTEDEKVFEYIKRRKEREEQLKEE